MPARSTHPIPQRKMTYLVTLAAVWPWGPPGAELVDVLFGYGSAILIVGMVAWRIGRNDS
jgi:hypothetical protein